jgi:transcriptional regulator with PAS, ATPase and Fis domain
MIGESAVMREIFNLLARIASSNSTTLLTGESGTGKELAARAIHQLSERHAKPFVALNCAVLTPNLLETELFGHERGAFTGATTQKRGKFELADGGTIFLDEIGELQPELQAKLLRFLQEREFERVGGTRSIKVDVRVLAATNKNLKLAIERRTFREDLFFRLNVVSVRLPSLRERTADIPLLVEHFLKKYSIRCKRPIMSISKGAMAALCAYDWPGNVRELENAIERAVVLSATESIQIEDLPEAIVEATANDKRQSPKLYEDLRAARRKIIKQAIEDAAGNYTVAAGQLGIHPNNLHRMAKALGLKPT